MLYHADLLSGQVRNTDDRKMSVIAEISVPADEFQLGRIVDLSHPETVELESLVPAGDRPVPYLRVYDADLDSFEEAVVSRPTVESVDLVDAYDDRALYTVEWSADGDDGVFQVVRNVDASVLSAVGTSDAWEFERRFSSQAAMSAFQAECRERDLGFDVLRVYSPSEPEFGPWFGLTDRQHEALVLAVEGGTTTSPGPVPPSNSRRNSTSPTRR